jgi:glycosyltransferase involved in cell wall biosynthesis
MKTYTVLHTIDTGGPGGAETVLLDLASKLDEKRFRSIALLTEDRWLAQRLRERGIETLLADSGSWYDFRLLRSIVRLIQRKRIDLIHSHLPDLNFYGCLARRLTGTKAIATYHGPVELSGVKEFKNAVKFWSVRHSADTVVVVCDHVGRMLVDIGFPAAKIVRIYNGIEPGQFNGGVGRGNLRRELGLSVETRLVGMVANIRRSKGYEHFIKAARLVMHSVPHCRFVAVGEFDDEIGRGLIKLVRELDLEDRFHFLGFRDDIPSVLTDLDIFVLSSISEGFPLVTLEAMAASKPVVVTRCGGPEEVVDDGRTGLLVPPASPEVLAARICELLLDPERAMVMGRNARASVLQTFSVDKMVRNYETLYETVLLQHT